MEISKYINVDYVPRVDLTTLGNTFNTLEAGHKEAVKAATALKESIAALEMDSSEDGYKQELINSIEDTVAQNTIYGNSYAALDDIILQVGDITTNGDVIGRVRNNFAKKEYDAKVDAMDIPEGMKQMYKEENPYYYVEGAVDPKSGRKLPGEEWKAKTNPVNHIDFYSLMDKALANVSKESGYGEIIYFLDANGKPTSNASESVDGAMYKQVGTRWEKLPEEKIRAAIDAAIQATPGAIDSLNQEYRYTKWQYKKQKEYNTQHNITRPVVMEGFTDENGEPMSMDGFIAAKIDPFVDAAKYSRVETKTTWGTALENKFKREAAKQLQNGGGNDYLGNILSGIGTVGVGAIKVSSNNYSQLLDIRDKSNKAVIDILGKFNNNNNLKTITDTNKLIEYYINKGVTDITSIPQSLIKDFGVSLSPSEISTLSNAIVAYKRSKENIDKMYEAAGEDVDYLKFSDNLNREVYTNDNKFGRAVNEWIDKMLELCGGTINYNFGKNTFEQLKALYNVNDLRDAGLNYTLNNDIYTITINEGNKNKLYKLNAYAVQADNNASGYNIKDWFVSSIANDITPNNFRITNSNGDVITANPALRSIGNTTKNAVGAIPGLGADLASSTYNMINGYKPIATGMNPAAYNFVERYNPLTELSNDLYATAYNYNEMIDYIAEKEGQYGVSDAYISINMTDFGSFRAMAVEEYGDREGLTPAQKKQYQDTANKLVDNALASGQASMGQIYSFDNVGIATKDISKNVEYSQLIRYMYNTHPENISRVAGTANGIKDLSGNGVSDGYVLTMQVPNDIKTAKAVPDEIKDYAGKEVRLFITGYNFEGVDYNPAYNPKTLANNTIRIARSTNSDILNIGFDNNLGDTSIRNNFDGTYSTNIFGSDIDLTESAAERITANINRLESMKLNYKAGNYYNPNLSEEDNMNILKNAVDKLSTDFSQLTSRSPEFIYNSIMSYLMN